MKMVNGTGYNAAACQIAAAKEFTFTALVPCDLEPEAVSYAVCRFFYRSRSLCRTYVMESCALRFAKGKARKTRHYRCVIPAPLMELPGNWVKVNFAVDAVGVTIRRAALLWSYPEGAEIRRRTPGRASA